MGNEPRFRMGEEVYDLIDERLMRVTRAEWTERLGWRYKLAFAAKVHAFTGTGSWRSESDLRARK